MKNPRLLLTIVGLILVGSACQSRNSNAGPKTAETTNSPVSPTTTPADVAVQKWLGQWNGPEGTYLVLSQGPSQNNGKFDIKIRSLDSLDTYEGTATGDGIQFTRNGKTETIHAGNGEQTGMKWLLDKKNCLIIQSGEGFCRD